MLSKPKGAKKMKKEKQYTLQNLSQRMSRSYASWKNCKKNTHKSVKKNSMLKNYLKPKRHNNLKLVFYKI